MKDPCVNPFATDAYAQRQLISAMLRMPQLIDDFSLSGDLFTEADCKRIVEVMLAQHGRGEAFDEFTIAPHLEARQHDALANALEEQGDPSLVPSYAGLLKRQYLFRNLNAIGAAIVAATGAPDEDPEKLIDEAHKRLDELQQGGSRHKAVAAGEAAFRIEKKAIEAKRSGIPPGLRTGISPLDEILLPLQGDQLLIGAGATSMGKTSLATNIAINVAKQGTAVSYYSLEMGAEDLGARLIANETGIPVGNITSGRLSDDDLRHIRKATQTIASWPLHIEACSFLDAAQLMRRGRQHRRKYRTGLIIVDYVQLMRGRGKNFYEQVSETTRGLKIAAGELNVPIIALSQLNREPERRADGVKFEERYLRRRPKLNDLRESGSIEQDADVVIFLHREEVYLAREKPPLGDMEAFQAWEKAMGRHRGKADLVLAKQRQGKIGIATCSYDEVRFRFAGGAHE